MVKILNYKLGKKGYSTISVGIGIDYGRALMVKAGYSGSGLNDVIWMGDVVNSAWKSFKRLIERADTTLKEKFEVCQMVYEAKTRESIQRICRTCGIPEGTDLAEAYASFRNQTAHGEIKRPGNVEIATYQILRCFVYVVNLRRAGVPQEKIKEVLKRMF